LVWNICQKGIRKVGDTLGDELINSAKVDDQIYFGVSKIVICQEFGQTPSDTTGFELCPSKPNRNAIALMCERSGGISSSRQAGNRSENHAGCIRPFKNLRRGRLSVRLDLPSVKETPAIRPGSIRQAFERRIKMS